MKKPLLITCAFTLIMILNACKKDGKESITPESTEIESQFVRLLASDQDLVNYYIINPQKGTYESQAGQFANGSLYSSPSGRFVSVINASTNFVTFFDSGIEGHDDHAHIKGTPKWALTTANGTTPIHYYGRGDDMLIFNDGDGSISHFKESTLHSEANARTFAVGTAHHGAPALFNNNTIAVTEKDGSVPGTLPERVKVIDMNGHTLHTSTIQTGGIHGEAGNGELVMFGSANGILMVRKNGSQELINYPGSFGTNWLGSVYFGKECHQFIGFKSNYGLYKIDSISKTITTIEESSNLFSVTFDWEGRDLIVLYTDGTVKVLNGNDLSVISTRILEINFPVSGSKGNPVVTASKNYVYITDGINGKIIMYKKDTLEKVKEIILPGKPAKIALMGSLAKEDSSH